MRKAARGPGRNDGYKEHGVRERLCLRSLSEQTLLLIRRISPGGSGHARRRVPSVAFASRGTDARTTLARGRVAAPGTAGGESAGRGARVRACLPAHCGHRRCGRWGAFHGFAALSLRGLRQDLQCPHRETVGAVAASRALGDLGPALIDGDTVRGAARRCGVHKNTALRWRHRFFALPAGVKPSRLHGIVEADETYFLESHKGERHAAPTRRSCRQARPLRRADPGIGGARPQHRHHRYGSAQSRLSAGIRGIDHADPIQNALANVLRNLSVFAPVVFR